jgi:hypothetical protein
VGFAQRQQVRGVESGQLDTVARLMFGRSA